MVFDKTSFCRAVNENGSAYLYQAIELIKICRLFSAASHQSPDQDISLQSVLEACDTALEHAVNSRKKERGPTDQVFVNAIRKLYEYEKEYHPDNPHVKTRMSDAKKKDEENRKKEWMSAGDKTLRIVHFHILQSPSDRSPIIVEQALIGTSDLPDILWIFSHFAPKKPKDLRDKRYLTLAQNPHFYDGLPIFPTKSVDTFKTQPTEDYQGKIYILTNNERRIFLDLGEKRRVFDNVWKMNDTLIFKDIIGYLEGEAFVRKCIPDLPLSWSRMVHPEFQLEAAEDIEDWRAPILELWNSPRIRIHISVKCH